MEVNPGMSVILAIVVYALGLIYKRSKWAPDSKQMVAMITAVSIALGLLQAVITAQLQPLPVPPADTVQLIFVYIPQLLAWLVAQVGLVLSIGQGIYFMIHRLLFGNA